MGWISKVETLNCKTCGASDVPRLAFFPDQTGKADHHLRHRSRVLLAVRRLRDDMVRHPLSVRAGMGKGGRLRIDLAYLAHLAAEGFVDLKRHPAHPLTLANYTPKAQYDRAWGDHPILLDCRGLIFDDEGGIVARPFRKFFNLGEPGYTQAELPLAAPEVSEKLDGSMGTLYWLDGEPCIATRGSFDGEQARWATAFLRKRYGDRHFDRSLTYVFEIIYPANRIVVDYGSAESLTLIGMVDTESGRERPYAEVVDEASRLDLPSVQMVATDWLSLASTPRPNFEGYVLFWPETGQRVKVKLPDYLELHRLVTDFTPIRVWEAMRDGSLDRLIESGIPDEVFGWIKAIQGRIQSEYDALVRDAHCFADEAKSRFPARREQAGWILAEHRKISGLIFQAIDGRDLSKAAWAMVKPPGEAERFSWTASEATA